MIYTARRSYKLTIHQDVYEEYLHWVEGVTKPEKCAQRDQGQRRRRSAELERQKVLDVMKDGFPCGEISRGQNLADKIWYLLQRRAKLC